MDDHSYRFDYGRPRDVSDHVHTAGERDLDIDGEHYDCAGMFGKW
jgi:hypothetical protein